MSIIEEKLEKEKNIVIWKSLAEKFYEKQLRDIVAISHTDWYKQIKDYWIRVKESAEVQLYTIKEEDLKTVQLKRLIANDFLTFLENLEKEREIRKMVSN